MVTVSSRPSDPGRYAAGSVTTWVSMTPRTELSGTLSVVAVATDASAVGSSWSPAWSSAWAMTSREVVRASTVMCRRTVSWSNVVSWCTRWDTTSSPATAEATTSETRAG